MRYGGGENKKDRFSSPPAPTLFFPCLNLCVCCPMGPKDSLTEPLVLTDSLIIPAVAPLRIRHTLGAALRLIASEWRELLKILWVPSLLMGILGAFVPVTPDAATTMAHNMDILPLNWAKENSPNMLFGIISMLFQCWLGVAVLRYVILGEKSPGWVPAYQPQLWQYLWRAILLGLVIVIPCGIAAALFLTVLPKLVAIIGVLLCCLGAAVVATRIGLALPATAAGGDYYFRSAWRRTNGQATRIMTIKFLVGMMLLLPLTLIVLLMSIIGQAAPWIARAINYALVAMAQIAMSQTVEALLYAHFYPDAVSSSEQVTRSNGGDGVF